VIAESGNLLMLGTRPKDGGEWMQMSRALVDVGEKAIRAAERHDTKAVFDVGAEVYDVCTNCHAKYASEIARPNTQN
jgi:predicted solute-binding protein